MLGLEGFTSPEQFDSLADNLDPSTGNPLTAKTVDGRRVGLDMTFNSVKSVGIAREMAGPNNAGDPRIEAAHREAVAYTIGLVEDDMQCRVRVGKANENRTTSNLVAYRVTHRDTRINAQDQMPDCHLHDHVFIFNATYDDVEDKWKAAEIGQIKHDTPYYESIFHNRMASNLKELGYGIRRDGKAFEIEGIDRPLIEKFSRRSAYIKFVADKLGITNPESKAKLGATTRLGKTTELLDDLNPYYVSRLTEAERTSLSKLEGQPSYECGADKAVQYAIGHIFERQSVVDERRLYETAIRHGIGCVTVDEVQAEARRQGMLLKEKEATTLGVLAEESRIIDFAREGKGTMRPLGDLRMERLRVAFDSRLNSPAGYGNATTSPDHGLRPGLDATIPAGSTAAKSDTATSAALGQQKGRPDESKRPLRTEFRSDTATLSPEQQAMVSHVLTSNDQMVLVIGDAGTGKTRSIKTAFEQIDRPIEMLAPSAEASRGVLRAEGFSHADTVASFLLSEQRQSAVKNGVIWVDEAGLLAIKDLSKLVDIAKQQNARIVLQGDPKQHRSVVRHGNMMNVLQEYAGLPVGRLTEVWRQKHKGYRAIVADIAKGDRQKSFDALDKLGWVKTVDSNAPLVDEYVAGIAIGKEMLVIAPTHAEGDEVTAAIREKLKDKGIVSKDERVFETLRPLAWTDAEKSDPARYDGTEVLQFHRNSGAFRIGQRVRVADWKAGVALPRGEHFSVYRREELRLAIGDRVRITGGGHDTTKRHKLNNGSQYTVTGFTDKGDVTLSNGWTLDTKFGHLDYGYVATSHAAQGRTVDRVLIAMGSESRAAINAEQFYVSVSRGRESAKVFSDMPPEELKQAIQRTDKRKSATELMKPKPRKKSRRRRFLDRIKSGYEQLRDRVSSIITKQPEKDHQHER